MPLPELSLGRMIDWTCVSGENQAVSLLDEEFMVEFCLILKFVILQLFTFGQFRNER